MEAQHIRVGYTRELVKGTNCDRDGFHPVLERKAVDIGEAPPAWPAPAAPSTSAATWYIAEACALEL
jgi:hypothetical protein